MSDVLQETVALQLKREPWLVPDVGSWWTVTSQAEGGTGGIGGDRLYKTTLIDCICQVMDYGDGPLFEMFGVSTAIVVPTSVAFARRLLFVMHDDPGTALYVSEQDTVDSYSKRTADSGSVTHAAGSCPNEAGYSCTIHKPHASESGASNG